MCGKNELFINEIEFVERIESFNDMITISLVDKYSKLEEAKCLDLDL